VEPVAAALAVVEPVAAALAVVEPVAAALAVVEPVAAALAVVELVELAPVVREQERVPGQERELAAAAVAAVMLSKILTPVHTDRLTRTGSARECFRFKGAIRAGLVAAGLVAALFIGTNTRPS
jgi:hypothetical protein